MAINLYHRTDRPNETAYELTTEDLYAFSLARRYRNKQKKRREALIKELTVFVFVFLFGFVAFYSYIIPYM